MSQIPQHVLDKLVELHFFPGCATANHGPADAFIRDLDLNDLGSYRYFITPPESISFDLADERQPYWTLTKQGWGSEDEARELSISGLTLVIAAQIAEHIRPLTKDDAV